MLGPRHCPVELDAPKRRERRQRWASGSASLGKTIGVRRLLARPVARLGIECKDEQERFERERN